MIREGWHQIWDRTACWSITAFDLPTQVSSKRQDHLSLIADDATRYREPKVLKLSSALAVKFPPQKMLKLSKFHRRTLRFARFHQFGHHAAAQTKGTRMWTRIWRGVWMTLAMVGIAVILWVLLQPPHRTAVAQGQQTVVAIEPIRVVGPKRLLVSRETPLQRQLQVLELATRRVSFPLLTVSGSIIARVRPGKDEILDRWQFSTSELSATYSDWLKAKGEIEFAERQLAKTEELVVAETAYLASVAKRLESLTANGGVPEKELRSAKADLLKAQLQGDKDVFSAKSQLRLAIRARERLERELSQAGIEPFVFDRTVENMVLIVAHVPEIKMAYVKEEQACDARFYGLPDRMFPGHVETLSSMLTQDRRMLRVLFDLSDSSGVLKPGMFAEVGLGTDERDSLLVPSSSLLHIGSTDYVLLADGDEHWRVVEVKVGESHEEAYEVLEGLQPGARILGDGAVLLKPLVVKALKTATTEAKPKL